VPVFLLPRLRHDATGMPAAQSTGWISTGLSALAALSNNIETPSDYPPGVFVDAIPDIWGKSLLFAYALREGTHQFHKLAVAAYRGFLTMLALRLRRNYLIEIMRVDLASDVQERFLNAARKLHPSGGIARDISWSPLYLFLMEGEVAGMTSSLTLVAPREGADLTKPTACGLADGFRFVDPIAKLTPEEAGDVAAWVRHLSETVSAAPRAEDPSWQNHVCSVLNDFVGDLKRHAGLQEISAPRLDPAELSLTTPSIYRPLAAALGVYTHTRSHVELFNQRGLGSKKLLVIDPDTPYQWNTTPASVEIINNLTHASIAGLPLGVDRKMLGHFPLPGGYEWRRPEDFLLPHLAVVSSPEAFRDVAQPRGAAPLAVTRGMTPLIPIDSALLEYLPHDLILEKASFAEIGDGIEFSLQLPVNDGQRWIKARRVYPFSDLVRIDPTQLPVTEIWPGFCHPKWNHYFAFCANAGILGKYLIEPVASDPPADVRFERRADGFPEVAVTRLSAAPRIFALMEIQTASGAGHRSTSLGILFPKYREAEAALQARTQIGFDFGTTNTEIYLKIGEDRPEALALTIPTASLCNVDEGARTGALHRFFVPSCSQGPESGPFLSLMRRRRGQEATADPASLLESHVLFYRKEYANELLGDKLLIAYLKWDPANNADRRIFLFQLALHAAVEAIRRGASDIRIRYSYPTAFTPDMKQSLDAAWNRVIHELNGVLPVPVALQPRQTESVAAAHYFRHIRYDSPALMGIGSLVVDIGGGTSDVSVWRENRLQVQSSIRLSGREILLEPLESSRKETLELLFDVLQLDRRFRQPLEDFSGTMFFRYADALLRTYGEQVLRDLYLAAMRPEYKKLCSQITVRFGGLLYYAGMMLRSTKSAWNGIPAFPQIYVGGNGCRILHWLSPPEFNENSDVLQFFREVLMAAADFSVAPGTIKLIISREPKCEAACGLLHAEEGDLAVPEGSQERILAGEALVIGNSPREATSALSASDLSAGLVRIQGVPELQKYLEIYNRFASRPGQVVCPIDNLQDVIADAEKAVQNWCIDCQNKDVAVLQVQPLFVRGLQSLRNARWGAIAYGGKS
jgi:hypothetical protein